MVRHGRHPQHHIHTTHKATTHTTVISTTTNRWRILSIQIECCTLRCAPHHQHLTRALSFQFTLSFFALLAHSIRLQWSCPTFLLRFRFCIQTLHTYTWFGQTLRLMFDTHRHASTRTVRTLTCVHKTTLIDHRTARRMLLVCTCDELRPDGLLVACRSSIRFACGAVAGCNARARSRVNCLFCLSLCVCGFFLVVLCRAHTCVCLWKLHHCAVVSRTKPIESYTIIQNIRFASFIACSRSYAHIDTHIVESDTLTSRHM